MSISIVSRTAGADVALGGVAGILVRNPKTAGFNPAPYGTVITWQSAQFANVSTDGAAVVTAPDHGGIAGTYVAGPNTIYRTNQINGKPAYQFDGVAASLVSGTVANGIGTADFWLGIVFQPNGVSGLQDMFTVGAFSQFAIYRFGAKARCDAMNPTVSSGDFFADGVWGSFEAWRQSGVTGWSLNGVVDSSGPDTFSFPDNQHFNIATGDGDALLKGRMADFLLIKNQTNQTGLSAAWRAQYGL